MSSFKTPAGINRLRLICLIIALIPFFIYFPKTWPSLIFPLYFLGIVTLSISLTRTIQFGWVTNAFLLGATVIPVTVILMSSFAALFTGTTGNLLPSFIIPFLEETFKVLPLILLIVWMKKKGRLCFSGSDLLLLGSALGAGFTWTEDFLRVFLTRCVIPPDLFAMHESTLHWGWFYPFPSLTGTGIFTRDTPKYFIGHPAATGFIGMAMGFSMMIGPLIKSKFSKRIHWASWLFPLFIWLWMVADHAAFNYRHSHTIADKFTDFFLTINCHGTLSAWVFYLLVLVCLIFETKIIFSAPVHLRILSPFFSGLRLLLSQFAVSKQKRLFLRCLSSLLLVRRTLAFHLYVMKNSRFSESGERYVRSLMKNFFRLKGLIK
ncbi:MAG: PrsW family intramembrane metalloprotease [Candidatus Aureabacteria bacterium]|nr:PrsW family intramembrane metalloprotease [Candidatus Auribacterota bacterium]